MDKTQLITIIITAIVSVTAKALITWLISVIRSLAVINTIKGKLKALFNKPNRVIMGDLFALIFYTAYLVYFALREGAPSRIEILLAFGAFFAVLFMIVRVLFHVAKLKIEKENQNKL